jgi:regulator of protease activity HflC (stomatin/prohibitin superfamily)
MAAPNRVFSQSTNNVPKGGNMNTSRLKLIALLTSGVIGLLLVIGVGRGLVETNNAGFYQIKQAAVTGSMTVIDLPGTYARLFGDITTYHVSDMHYFSKSPLDGGSGDEASPIKVRFNDGGTADVSGAIKYRLPISTDQRLRLHQDFKNYNSFKHDLIRQTVAEAMMQTATLMKAEESYSTRRSEFTSLVEDQVKNGIYETVSRELKSADADGNERVDVEVYVKKDAKGLPTIRKISPLAQYGVEVISFTIKEIDFDATIDNLIQKKKEAEQMKVVARANAEKAKQDAITAREQGNARIAIEKANQDVEKIKEVTIAQKQFEVSQLNRKQAEQDSQAKITMGKAEAEVNKLKVAAGLTPFERATFAKETAVGVAHELASITLPTMMVTGGGSGGRTADPFEAVGLESLMRINDKMAKTSSEK